MDETPIPVIYQDRDLVAVNKPEGLATIPGRGSHAEDCLLFRLRRQTGDELLVVHRLDAETSGLILFARTAAAHRRLNTLFFERRVRKTYLALVHGIVQEDQFRADMPLREFGSGRIAPDPVRGKPCVTEFLVRERFEGQTLLEAYPLTGRRHQIRAHLYAVGHPVVGDRRYGERARQEAFPRLMLHALRLDFTAPSGRKLLLEVSPPPSFEEALRAFGGRTGMGTST